MQKILLYDKNFYGLMCAVYWSFHYGVDLIYAKVDYTPTLIDSIIYIHTDETIALKIIERIRSRFGQIALQKISHAFMSEKAEAGRAILTFIKFSLTTDKATGDYGNIKSHAVLKMAQSVEREVHRMFGLMRFSKLDSDIYYATFEPTYDILPFLIDHFKARLNDQHWVIHDIRRKKAAFYNGDCVYFNHLKQHYENFSLSEVNIKKNWQLYYEYMGIKERYSEKRRKQFMPMKYWAHLTEI